MMFTARLALLNGNLHGTFVSSKVSSAYYKSQQTAKTVLFVVCIILNKFRWASGTRSDKFCIIQNVLDQHMLLCERLMQLRCLPK